MGLFSFVSKILTSFSSKETADITNDKEIVPIEERLLSMTPQCDGLYPHEILVLSYAPSFTMMQTKFQGFWWYSYGIQDIPAILSNLSDKKYIQRGTKYDALNKTTVANLKKILKSYNLKVTGKKQELISRIQENISLDELSGFIHDVPYFLTDTGRHVLEKFTYIPYIHKHSIDGLNIWNITDLVNARQGNLWRDAIWAHLNEKSISYFSSNHFGLYCNTMSTMAIFCEEEERYEQALNLLFKVCIYDVSGLSLGFNPHNILSYSDFFDDDFNYLDDYFPYQINGLANIMTGIMGSIQTNAEELGWSENDLINHFTNILKKTKLPYSLFTNKEIIQIFQAEYNENFGLLKQIYSIAEARNRNDIRSSFRIPIDKSI